jgi:hypothetical protein
MAKLDKSAVQGAYQRLAKAKEAYFRAICEPAAVEREPTGEQGKRWRGLMDALFSIRPHFATAILDGSKTIELRTVAPRKPIERIWIYSTSPVQRIVGYFTPGFIRDATHEDCVKALVAGENPDRYFAYEVLNPVAISPINPREDLELGYKWHAPQSWRYCWRNESAELRRLAP